MVKQALRLSMALMLSTGLAGIALAQGNTEVPGQTTMTPSQKMEMPPAGNGSATTNPATPQAAMPNTGTQTMPNTGMQNGPNTGTQYGQEANLSPTTIMQAQRRLRSEGFYKGKIDGRFGPQTRVAVRKFQQQNGLAANSMLDQETMQHLMTKPQPHG
jgi:peptidoglycan hydrolase-like protein with peptidoglycan-binding domain